MVVIKTAGPLRRVFLKNQQVQEVDAGEFRETDFSEAEVVPLSPDLDEERVSALVGERLSQAREEWEAEAARREKQALEQGRAEGVKEAETKMAARSSALTGMVASLATEREKVMHEVELVAVDLALAVARRFVTSAAILGDDVIKQSIKSAVQMVTEKEKLVIRVNPEDLEEVKSHQDDIIFIGDGIGKLDVRADKTIVRGGCVVETEIGNIDARLDTRLAELEKALKQAYYSQRAGEESGGSPDDGK
jgi:flagellar assembly protein FliH